LRFRVTILHKEPFHAPSSAIFVLEEFEWLVKPCGVSVELVRSLFLVQSLFASAQTRSPFMESSFAPGSEPALVITTQFLQASLDALTAHIAVLNEKGVIIATNAAWRRFAQENGFQSDGVGVSYLDVCDSAFGPCSDEARQIAQGIRDVIARRRDSFELEYPCHSPTEKRWFLARVTRFANTDPAEPVRAVVAHENITARHLAEESLRENEERYRAFVANSSEAIWRVELEVPVPVTLPIAEQIAHFYKHAYLAECNDAMARMYGYESCAQIQGARMDALLSPNQAENIAYLTAFIESGYRLSDAISHERDRYGNDKYFLNNLVAVPDANGLVWRAWGTQRDITVARRHERERERLLEAAQRARLQAEQERANAEAARLAAEAASRAKDEFLAVISHELRTPLTAVLGWANLLRGSQPLDEATQNHALEVIERNVRAQAQIINDLLDVSRITAGKISLDLQPLEPAPVMRAALEAVLPAARAKEIKLQSDIQITGAILGDAARLQQIVWNLLSNAVKFTPRGGSVAVRLFRENGHAVLTVSDSGPGLGQAFLPHAFERFRQADSSSTREHGGLGLGLAIVRHLAEMHGGSVSVKNGGELPGATFTLRFPLPENAPANSPTIKNDASLFEGTAPQQPASPALPRLDGLLILVVEDEAATREMIALVLTRQGASVREAESVAQALEECAGRKPDLVISDIGMPGADGYDLARQLQEWFSPLPSLALTAYARPEERQLALRAGFADHIAKPILPETLVATVAKLAGRGT
jgi:signal transduction histidine kinase